MRIMKLLSKTFLTLLMGLTLSIGLHSCSAQDVMKPENIINKIEKVMDWQLANPTGKGLNTWEYGPFYCGIMSLHHLNGKQKNIDAMMEMGKTVDWQTRPRPYDANVLCISQSFLELYEVTGDEYMIKNSRFVMDAPMKRHLKYEVQFENNKYWWEYWTWCDALFMAPPAYARLATIKKEPKYMDFMTDKWHLVSDHLYSKTDSLYYRDDRFKTMKSKNGGKIFWSRGNGWVVGGLVRVLQYMPKDHPERKFFEQQFIEMTTRLISIQVDHGFWSQSLYDAENYPQKESSGTAFFIYGMAWGVNNGLLDKDTFMPTIEKGWKALNEAVFSNGKFGYVQEVGDSPTEVVKEDTESYGSGAFILAGTEMYKLMGGKPLKTN
jgi:unsaturated rhamnogalacturonyl hydrolase